MADNVKGDCPTCEGSRNAAVMAHHDSFAIGGDNTRYYTTYRVLKCGGCNEIYFQKESYSSDDFVLVDDGYEPNVQKKHWPEIKRQRPAWMLELHGIDSRLHALLEESYRGFDAELRVLVAIGLRTTLDRATEKLGIDSNLSFEAKLDALVDKGQIAATERKVLAVLINAGSAAAHRGWRPTEAELETMVNIVESFVMRTFILEAKATELENRVPARAPRKAAKRP